MPVLDRALWREFRAGNLTRAYRDVLLPLRTYPPGGLICPAHATVAEGGGCSVRTVQRALAMGRGSPGIGGRRVRDRLALAPDEQPLSLGTAR